MGRLVSSRPVALLPDCMGHPLPRMGRATPEVLIVGCSSRIPFSEKVSVTRCRAGRSVDTPHRRVGIRDHAGVAPGTTPDARALRTILRGAGGETLLAK